MTSNFSRGFIFYSESLKILSDWPYEIMSMVMFWDDCSDSYRLLSGENPLFAQAKGPPKEAALYPRTILSTETYFVLVITRR